MAPIEALQLEGLQFPGQEVKVKINQVLQSDSVEVNANETGSILHLGIYNRVLILFVLKSIALTETF